MRKITAKKVFAIIGIVLGSVTAFVGAVVGVMAAMGKFKTPIVFPTELVFLNQDQIVVETVPYDTGKTWEEQFKEIEEGDPTPAIKSIMLQGNNPSSEHAVNQKKCYIWFEQNIGVDLITLCNKEGKPLKDLEGFYVDGKYKVNCNEPIYYMINKIADDYQTNGKIVLKARSENNKAQVNSPLTFWIDRSVESVFVDVQGERPIKGEENKQTIEIGVDIGFDFKYVVETPLSLNPIVGHSNVDVQGKEIELYYVGDFDDYIKVTEEAVVDENSPLNKFLTVEDGVFKFKSNIAEEFEFKIAIFSTYAEKMLYEASIEGLEIQNPNYHRTQSMKLTTLKVLVQTIDIVKADLLGENVVLNLYSQNDYITLDGVSGIDGAKNNNLELYMEKGDVLGSVVDYSRFDEVSMNALTTDIDKVWADLNPVFVGMTPEGEEEFVYETETKLQNMLYAGTGVFFDKDKNIELISYLYKNDDLIQEFKYYCVNGAAVYDNKGTPDPSDDEVKLLKSGSYLNFYLQDAGSSKIANFDCEIIPVEGKQGREKSWQIITKEIPDLSNGTPENLDDDLKLCIGILVVNNKGEFKIGQFFDTIPVSVKEVDLNYVVNKTTLNLDTTFTDLGEINYGKTTFADVARINAGSYDSVVMVTEHRADEKYIVNVVPEIEFFIGGINYVLVGGFDAEGNYFVQVDDDVTYENTSCELRLLQLRNDFGKRTQDTINSMLAMIDPEGANNKITFTEEDKIIHSLLNETITINSKYVLNPNLLSFYYYQDIEGGIANYQVLEKDDIFEIYENTTEHWLMGEDIYSELKMLDRVLKYYWGDPENPDLHTDKVSVNIDQGNVNLSGAYECIYDDMIVAIGYDARGVCFDAKNCLSDTDTLITATLRFDEVYVDLPKFKILSGSPDGIQLNDKEGENPPKKLFELNLDQNKITAEQTITVNVNYDAVEGYVYELKHGLEAVAAGFNIFNSEIGNFEQDLGFQGTEDKGQTLKVSYEAVDKSIVDYEKVGDDWQVKIKKHGNTIIVVKIGETIRYFKIVVNAQDFDLTTLDNKTTFDINVSSKNCEFNINNEIDFNNDGNDDGILACLTYNDAVNVPLSTANYVYLDNVRSVYYGNGTLTVSGNTVDGWEFKKEGADNSVLTIKDEGDGWKITKHEYYISLTALFDIVTINGTKTITLNLISSVEVGVNDIWNEKREFYAGTSVLLLSQTEGDDHPVFKGKDLQFKINGSSVDGYVYVVPETSIEQYLTIEIFYNSTKIIEFTDFIVKANAIETLNISELQSEQDYGLDALFNLKAYQNVVYGEKPVGASSVNLYYVEEKSADGSVVLVRNSSMLTGTVDSSKIKITSDGNSNPSISYSSNILSIGQMTELDAKKTRRITLQYQYVETPNPRYKDISSYNVDISNKHIINDKNIKVINALKEYDIDYLATVSGFNLTEIRADNLEFEVKGGKFRLKNALVEELKDVELTLVFTKNGDSQILTYSLKMNIHPYLPNENETVETAYSGLNYDLLNNVYNVNDLETNSNVKKLTIKGIKDADGKDITSEIISSQLNSNNGYTDGASDHHCIIKLAEIVGDSRIVYVEYEITYGDNNSYVYPRKLKIENRQSIEVENPESDLQLTPSTFKFISGYEQDGANISGSAYSSEGIYNIQSTIERPIRYEPVMIYTDEAYVLDFYYDQVKKISRATVLNRKIDDLVNTSTELKIELIAYQTLIGLDAYAAAVNCNYDTNKVLLPYAGQGMFGSLIFKLITKSGNYEYFYVYLYCAGSSAKVNVENNLNIVAHNGSCALNDYSEKAAVVEDLNETKYIDMISTLVGANSTNELFKDEHNQSVTFKKLFGKEFNPQTTKLYLYNGVYAGETISDPFDYQNKQWMKLDETDTVVLDDHFNTITLGLMFDDGIQKYIYGTITIYVQPENAVLASNVEYKLPNGEFVANIAANANSVASPFGTNWTASIESIDGVKFDEEKHAIYSTSGSVLNITGRVAQDTIIRVKYVRDDGTVAFVNYTYKATSLPESTRVSVGNFVKYQLIDASEIYNGDKDYFTLIDGVYSLYTHNAATWDIDKLNLYEVKPYFNNKITLKDNAEFMGTYQGDYSVKILSGETSLNGGYNTTDLYNNVEDLTFIQTTTENIVKIEIAYTNYDGDSTREFTFVVRQGIYFDEDKTSTESGLMTSRRIKTLVNNYESNVGSTLEVKYETCAADLYKYQIGGLTIYTNKSSKLELIFDVNNYVVKNDGNILGTEEKIEVTSSESLKFVHSAQEMPVKMTINVKNGENLYATKDFFISVVKTYSRLNAVYCVEGADHENVPGYVLDNGEKKQNKIESLHEVLLGSTRFELKGVIKEEGQPDPIVNLSAMGFVTYGNPNYIEFSVGGNASIKGNDEIVFNQVTKNTECYVYLNNDAGMEENSVWYVYQIMASDKEDGLNFATNGYHLKTEGGIEYVSFLMNDTDNSKIYTSELYVIGSMLDLKNTTIFNVSVDEAMADPEVSYVNDEEITGSVINKKGKTQPSSDKENDYVNAIQYKFEIADYTYYLTYDKDNNSIELIVIRPEGKVIKNQIELTLNIGGVNGDNTIVKGLKIVLSNYQISSKYEDSSDTTIYAGYIINLSEKVNNDSSAISYVLDESVYRIDGKDVVIAAGENDNDLFKFVDKNIQTKAVGSDVRASINFVAYADGYAITRFTYNFQVKLNLQIVVNGEDLAPNIDNSNPETNFILTTGKDADGTVGFPIQINFLAGSRVAKTGDDKDIDSIEDMNYHRVLAFDLYKLKQQGSDLPLLLSKDDVRIQLNSNIENGILEIVDNSYIRFIEDYTGDIELLLSVKTKNGTYSVYWTIHVFGIKNQTYVSKNPEFARMENSSLPFNSGVEVSIINSNSTDTGVAIKMENSQTWASSSIELKYVYDYVINTFNNDTTKLSNEELFTKGDTLETYQGGGKAVYDKDAEGEPLKTNKLSIYLPSVPATDLDTQQSYLVTYRVYVEYLGLTDIENKVKVFYVSYRVINYQQLEAPNADVNVANLTNDKYLELFYYVQSNATYRLEYNNGDVQLKVSGTAYNFDATKNEGSKRYFVDDGAEEPQYYYDLSTNGIYDISNTQLTSSNLVVTTGGTNIVFESNFSNIFEYQEFMDRYFNVENSVQIYDKEKDVEYYFTLEEIDAGRYGIDLSTQFKDANKFKNELCAELMMVEKGVATVTVPAYSSENTNGFRLTTTDKIKANTRDGAGVRLSEMFLSTYFVDKFADDAVTLDTPIIGVGSADVSWVTTIGGGTITKSTPETIFATIRIPTGQPEPNDYNVYTVKKVVYSAGEADLYVLEQEFYYIASNEVVVPDYRAIGIEDWLFNIAYKEGETDQIVDLTKAFKVWSMNLGSLEWNNADLFGGAAAVSFTAKETITLPSYDASTASVKMSSETLRAFKKENPNKSYYPTISAKLNVNGKNYLCDIVFELPEYVAINSTFSNSTIDLTVDLIGELYVPVKVGGKIEYQELTTDHSYSIYETEYLKSYKDGVLTFDSEKIDTYFEETDSAELHILCELTTQDGTIEFEIVVKKSVS